MPHSGDGTSWDEAVPEDNAEISEGAVEIRDLRKALRIRVEKEHIAPTTGSGGGEHKAGAAVAYWTTAAPTQKPDGASALDADDAGRLWVHSTNEYAKVRDTDSWNWLQVVAENIAANAVTYGHITTIATGGIGRVAFGVVTFTGTPANIAVDLGWQPSFIIIACTETDGSGANYYPRVKHSGMTTYVGRSADADAITSCASIAATGFTMGTGNIAASKSYGYMAASLWGS